MLHLAAQPMVRRSLRDPAVTYEVNVMGTVNVLEAVRRAGERVRAVVVVTSDKCYENTPARARRFAEDDPLGGARSVLELEGLRGAGRRGLPRSFFAGERRRALATARAGNVIGGGDWGEDRLLADACARSRAASRCGCATPTRCARGSTCSTRSAATCCSPQALCARRAARAAPGTSAPRRGDARAGRLDRASGSPSCGRARCAWRARRARATRPRRRTWRSTRAPPSASSAGARAWGLERGAASWSSSGTARSARGEDMRAVSLAQIERFARAGAWTARP